MVEWTDIVNAVNGFIQWLQGLGAGFTNSLGELGSWIFGGFQWLGDRFREGLDTLGQWFKNALSYLADKFREAYEIIAIWISQAIQWVGSGLSYIGQNLYAFGQWLWNGIAWIGSAVWDLVTGTINWLYQQLSSIWNTVSDFINGFVSSFNQTINSWIKGLRAKFKHLLLVNLTVPNILSSFEKFAVSPSFRGLLGMVLTPIAGAIIAELLDAVIPAPQSESVNIFPPFTLPSWIPSPLSLTKPEYFVTPAQPSGGQVITPPTPGYRNLWEQSAGIGTSYDTSIRSMFISKTTCTIETEYSLSLNEILPYVVSTNTVATEYSTQ
jgi:hypothetical protein